MKKTMAFLLVLTLALGMAQGVLAEGKLVVYTTVSDAVINAIIPEFEAQTGITVEPISMGAGELLKKIEAEKENPQGDVLFGCALASITAADPALFEAYVSPNDAFIYEQYQNKEGLYTRHNLATRCLLVNTNLIGDIEITGYDSLLNPALKGKIAHVDPSASSSGYGHLVNQLYDMGNGDPEQGWAYVEAFVKNLDGKLLNSSGAVWKGVMDGEYTVGLTYEEVAMAAVKSGAPVKIIFAKEGTYIDPSCVAVIAGAKNMDNAKLFVDFIISKDVQDMYEGLNLRGTRNDLTFSDVLKDTGDILMANVDPAVASANKTDWLAKFKDIFVAAEE